MLWLDTSVHLLRRARSVEYRALIVRIRVWGVLYNRVHSIVWEPPAYGLQCKKDAGSLTLQSSGLRQVPEAWSNWDP